MSSAMRSVVRGLLAYLRHRVEGWRTGSRGSQVFLVVVLVAMVALTTVLAELVGAIVPMSMWLLFLMVGLMLLRAIPLLFLVAALTGVATWTSWGTGFEPTSRSSALIIFGLAAALALYQASRQRSGLPMALSEAVLTELRDRLQRQGKIPRLPAGWRAQSEILTAHGPNYSGDFVVADLRAGRWLEMALVDMCGKGTSVGPQALQFAGALGGLIGVLEPRDLMSAANRFLLRQESEEALATAVHVRVDLVTGDYTLTSAGHPPALRWQLPQRGWSVEQASGIALGVIDDVDFTSTRGRLRPGEALMFYTDGVIESADRDPDLGIAWLRSRALHAVEAAGFERLPRRVLKGVPTGVDDCAIVVLERQHALAVGLTSAEPSPLAG